MEKSQSGIITTILLILLVLATIITVWNVVNRVVKTGAEGIGTEALTVNLEITEAKVFVTGGAQIKVKRGAGKGDITELKFIFEKENGESEIITRKAPDYKMPDELETKIYDFSASEINEKIEKVSVAPMFGTKAGIEVKESDSKIKKDSEGNRIYDAPQSLISWWKFDGNAEDSVGGNDGTASGGVNLNFDDAIRGKVASFDGIDDYVILPPSSVPAGNEITFEAWLYGGNTLPKQSQLIWAQNAVQRTLSLHWVWENGVIYFQCGGTGGAFDTILKSLQESEYKGIWSHWAFTKNAVTGEMKIYRNGILWHSGTGNIPLPEATSVVLGEIVNYAYFDGMMDEVKIYNKALSADEIKAIYNNQKK